MKKQERKPRARKTEERKAWEREQKINRIVDIVQELFFTRGYDGTTVDDIARAAGYTKRSIYSYFKDRDDLFLAVVYRCQVLFRETLERALQGGSGSRVILLGRAFYRFSLDHPDHFNLIMTYESRLHRYYAPKGTAGGSGFMARCQGISTEYGAIVTGAIDEDIRGGRISTGLTAQQLMLVLWGQVLGFMQIVLMRKKSFEKAYGITPDSLFEEYLRMVTKSLQ